MNWGSCDCDLKVLVSSFDRSRLNCGVGAAVVLFGGEQVLSFLCQF